MHQRSIAKILSKNDAGETGGHQAGILVPKDAGILSFFPQLDVRIHNPRCHILFHDESDTKWEFAFIYYNGKLFGGTRNEYRLTRMTNYIRSAHLFAGDEIVLTNDGSRYSVQHRRQRSAQSNGVLKLGTAWRLVNI